jgi:hypothetical protein
MESAFGTVGLVAGAFDSELGSAAESVVAIASATSCGFSAASSRPATASSTVAAATERQVAVVARSARPEHS